MNKHIIQEVQAYQQYQLVIFLDYFQLIQKC